LVVVSGTLVTHTKIFIGYMVLVRGYWFVTTNFTA
jgi:hypothetical protein